MADYYPILARAVAALPHNDAQARQDLYARARSIVAEQLRGRDSRSAGEAEYAALETAIRKIEAAAPPTQTRTKGELRRPARRVAAATSQERADSTARSLSKILQAVQPDETGEAALRPPRRKSMNGTEALAAEVQPNTADTSEAKAFSAAAELGGAPNSFGTLLFATAYIVTAMAFTGVTTVRCIVWLYQGVIGYPILLAIVAVTLALFVFPPLVIFRKNAALPSFDDLLRLIHSASRRVL